MKHKKQKAGALALALLLLTAVFPVSAFAAETSGSSGQTSVTYTAEASYVVRIPESVTANGDEVELELVSNTTGKDVIVSVDTANTFNSDGNLYLHNSVSGDELRCSIDVGGTKITASNNRVAKWLAIDGSNADYGKFRVLVEGTPKSSGTYTGTIYFTISTADAN